MNDLRQVELAGAPLDRVVRAPVQRAAREAPRDVLARRPALSIALAECTYVDAAVAPSSGMAANGGAVRQSGRKTFLRYPRHARRANGDANLGGNVRVGDDSQLPVKVQGRPLPGAGILERFFYRPWRPVLERVGGAPRSRGLADPVDIDVDESASRYTAGQPLRLCRTNRPMATTDSYTIDPAAERLLHISEIPDLLERWGARRPHRNAITRWRTAGVRGLRLPTLLVGGRRYSSEQAVRWWLGATTAAEGAAARVATEQRRSAEDA